MSIILPGTPNAVTPVDRRARRYCGVVYESTLYGAYPAGTIIPLIWVWSGFAPPNDFETGDGHPIGNGGDGPLYFNNAGYSPDTPGFISFPVDPCEWGLWSENIGAIPTEMVNGIQYQMEVGVGQDGPGGFDPTTIDLWRRLYQPVPVSIVVDEYQIDHEIVAAWETYGYEIPSTADSTTDVFDATAHGLADGNTLRVTGANVAAIGLAVDTTYFVVNATTDTYQLAATLAGTPLDLLTDDSLDAGPGIDSSAESSNISLIGSQPFPIGKNGETSGPYTALINPENPGPAIIGYTWITYRCMVRVSIPNMG